MWCLAWASLPVMKMWAWRGKSEQKYLITQDVGTPPSFLVLHLKVGCILDSCQLNVDIPVNSAC